MADIQTYIVPLTLVAVILYAVTMWIVRKIQNGENFDLNKTLQTLGLGALAAITLYIATGVVPPIDAVLTQMASIAPNEGVLAAVGAIFYGLFEQFILKGKLGTKPLISAPSPSAGAARPGFVLPRDGTHTLEGKDGYYLRQCMDKERAGIPDDQNYQWVSPQGNTGVGDKSSMTYLVTHPDAAGWRQAHLAPGS